MEREREREREKKKKKKKKNIIIKGVSEKENMKDIRKIETEIGVKMDIEEIRRIRTGREKKRGW